MPSNGAPDYVNVTPAQEQDVTSVWDMPRDQRDDVQGARPLSVVSDNSSASSGARDYHQGAAQLARDSNIGKL